MTNLKYILFFVCLFLVSFSLVIYANSEINNKNHINHDSISLIKKFPLQNKNFQSQLNLERKFDSISKDSNYHFNTKDTNSNIQPNKYIIPNNLLRKELKRKKDTNQHNCNKQFDSSINQNSIYFNNNNPNLESFNYYNNLFCLSNNKSIEIDNIIINQKSTHTVITFLSNKTISDYQKPEISGHQLIFRFPNADNNISNIKNISKEFPVKSIKQKKIRNILVYYFELESSITDFKITRTNSKSIQCVIYYNDINLTKNNISDKRDNPETHKSKIPINKHKWALDVIVLDPGHGGEDVGAISLNGVYEKDLTLDVAKKVRDYIHEEFPDTKVVMTRSSDVFVELFKRGKIANENHGKLFISIHFNSMPKKPHKSNGIETYILRPGRNDDAIRVANKENESVKLEKENKYYKSLSNEELIVATMAQSAFVKFSEKFATILQEEVAQKTGLKNRGVNQAGFYVLVGASMANVLFEGGFLSNPSDEEFISSELGKKKIAQGIFNAIKKYQSVYQQLIKE